MNLYLDTEFNGFGGALMSMGIVSGDGDEWYEVLTMPDDVNPWVQENVIPVLGKDGIGESAFRSNLHAFLKKFDNPTIHVDWYADAVWFFECLRGADPSETLNYPCSVALHSGLPDYPSQGVCHNALCDAKGLKEYLT